MARVEVVNNHGKRVHHRKDWLPHTCVSALTTLASEDSECQKRLGWLAWLASSVVVIRRNVRVIPVGIVAVHRIATVMAVTLAPAIVPVVVIPLTTA